MAVASQPLDWGSDRMWPAQETVSICPRWEPPRSQTHYSGDSLGLTWEFLSNGTTDVCAHSEWRNGKRHWKVYPPQKINKQNKQKRIWNTPRLKTGKSDFPFTETVRLFKGWELRISRGRNGVFYFRNAQKPMKRGGPLDTQPLVTAGARTMAPESSTLHWQCFLQKTQNQATHQGHHWLETKITFHWTKEIVQSLPANTKNRKPWLQSSKPWF